MEKTEYTEYTLELERPGRLTRRLSVSKARNTPDLYIPRVGERINVRFSGFKSNDPESPESAEFNPRDDDRTEIYRVTDVSYDVWADKNAVRGRGAHLKHLSEIVTYPFVRAKLEKTEEDAQ